METVKVGGQWYAIATQVAQRIRRIVEAYRRMKAERDEALEQLAQARANITLLAYQVHRLERQAVESDRVLDELLAMEETKCPDRDETTCIRPR